MASARERRKELHRIMGSRSKGQNDTAQCCIRRIRSILFDDDKTDDEVIDALVKVIEAWEEYRYPNGHASEFIEDWMIDGD